MGISIKNYNTLLFLVIIVLVSSCVGGKYVYEFDTGKNLDFSNGKWVFNNVHSNSEFKDNKRLFRESYEEFEKILGDSLIDLTTLRSKSLVKPHINFEPTRLELKELYEYSKCDFLINIRGQIVSNNASSFYSNDQRLSYSTSNRSAVFIKIFDLKNGILLSSSEVQATSTEEHSELENNGALNWTTKAESMMIRAAEGLIMKYNKYRTDK
jgi:hypothetical protein